MNTTDCSLVLFATNSDFKAGKGLSHLSEVPLSEVDHAARVFAAECDVPGSTVRAYDKDWNQIGLWLYHGREFPTVRLDIR